MVGFGVWAGLGVGWLGGRWFGLVLWRRIGSALLARPGELGVWSPRLTGVGRGQVVVVDEQKAEGRIGPVPQIELSPEEEAVQRVSYWLQQASSSSLSLKIVQMRLSQAGFVGHCKEFLEAHFRIDGSNVTIGATKAIHEASFCKMELPEEDLTFGMVHQLMEDRSGTCYLSFYPCEICFRVAVPLSQLWT